MKRLPYIFLILLSPYISKAQFSIVSNGSFEEYVICPYGFATFTTTVWYQFTQGNPDYYNACSTSPTTMVPKNQLGYQNALGNCGYAGIVTYSRLNPNYREYMACFLPPMKVGSMYEVTINVSLADSSSIGADNFGIYFGDTAGIYTNTTAPLPLTPQVSFSDTVPVTDKDNWVKLTQFFTPTTAFTHMILGGFKKDNEVKASKKLPAGVEESYYYIDQVTITEVASGINDIDNKATVNIFPNPNKGNFKMQTAAKPGAMAHEAEIDVLNMLGQVVYHSLVQPVDDKITAQVDMSNAVQGMYMLRLKWDGETANTKFVVSD